jgi:hypothetical protein
VGPFLYQDGNRENSYSAAVYLPLNERKAGFLVKIRINISGRTW